MRAFIVGQILDGNGGKPLVNGVLLEDRGRIVGVGARGAVAVPEHAQVVEAPNATLLPGLMDTHVHLAYSGSPSVGAFRAEASEQSYPLLALRAAKHARETLEWGFTAVRDLNAPGGVIIDLARAVNLGYVRGSRIKACGLGLSATGGHMDPPGWGDHVRFEGMTLPCDGPDAFRRGVREQVKRGADFIKINLCVGSRRDLSVPYRQEMTDAEIEAAIDEAHRLERKVAAHTSGGPAVTTAVGMGLDTVEHGHWVDERTADLMAEKGAYYIPTLLVNERNFDFTPEQMGVNQKSWAWLEKAREDKWASLARVRKAGVKIGCGTDAGFMLPHGQMNAIELELLVRGGLTPMEAIVAATKTNAELMELDQAGVLEVGKVADLVLVAGDPLEDIRVLQKQENLRVFKDGAEVTRPDLLAKWLSTEGVLA
ncbi:MAG: amidohydrolase family protein [Meiothermus sp.]|nr:amidohydrolase family protein [Meiothermus sp.]